METINNFKDLCEFLSADSPSDLNRRMHKGTDCGASISVRVGRVTRGERSFRLIFNDGPKHLPVLHSVLTDGKRTDHLRLPESLRNLFDLSQKGKRVVSKALPTYATLYRALQDYAKKGEWLLADTFLVERTFNPSAGKFLVVVREKWVKDETEWHHNGGDWSKLTIDSPLVSFSIQTIVEGSDVTVDGEEMALPIATKAVQDWIDDMEKQSSFYWERDNSLWYRLRNTKTGTVRTLQATQGEFKWHQPTPKALRKKVEDYILDDSFDLSKSTAIPGMKNLTVEEFCNDTTF